MINSRLSRAVPLTRNMRHRGGRWYKLWGVCRAHKRGALLVALLRQHLRPRQTRCSSLAFSRCPLHAPIPPSAMHHALCVTLHRTRLSEPTRTRDKHRAVIDICPYRSKGLGIIRPSDDAVGGGTIETMSSHPITIATISYLRHASRAPSFPLAEGNGRVFIAESRE